MAQYQHVACRIRGLCPCIMNNGRKANRDSNPRGVK